MTIGSVKILQRSESTAMMMNFSVRTCRAYPSNGGESSLNWALIIYKNPSNTHRCDNLRDCPRGDDEDECKFCNYDEFKCFSDQQCISEKWHCDGSIDCSDGSDESDCDISDDYDGNVHEISSYYDEDDVKSDYGGEEDDLSAIDDDKIVSTGDGIKPIFVNPNSTSSSSEVVSDNSSEAG